jgi:hypothetical protein
VLLLGALAASPWPRAARIRLPLDAGIRERENSFPAGNDRRARKSALTNEGAAQHTVVADSVPWK